MGTASASAAQSSAPRLAPRCPTCGAVTVGCLCGRGDRACTRNPSHVFHMVDGKLLPGDSHATMAADRPVAPLIDCVGRGGRFSTHGADGQVFTIGWDNTTSGVAGEAIGVIFAAKQQTATTAQIASQFGGTLPQVVDLHLAAGPNPHPTWSSLGVADSAIKCGVFQVGTDANGNTTLTQLWAGPMQFGTTFAVPGVTIDPNGGGFALFTGNTNDPVTFSISAPGAPAPAAGTPGGTMPSPAPSSPGGGSGAKPTDTIWLGVGIVLALFLGFMLLDAYGSAKTTLRRAVQ